MYTNILPIFRIAEPLTCGNVSSGSELQLQNIFLSQDLTQFLPFSVIFVEYFVCQVIRITNLVCVTNKVEFFFRLAYQVSGIQGVFCHSNSRLVTLLPLSIPNTCALRIILVDENKVVLKSFTFLYQVTETCVYLVHSSSGNGYDHFSISLLWSWLKVSRYECGYSLV